MDQFGVGHVLRVVVAFERCGDERAPQLFDDRPRNRIVGDAHADRLAALQRLVGHPRRCVEQEGDRSRQIAFENLERGVVHPAVFRRPRDAVADDAQLTGLFAAELAQSFQAARRAERTAVGVDRIGGVNDHAVALQGFDDTPYLPFGGILRIDAQDHTSAKIRKVERRSKR